MSYTPMGRPVPPPFNYEISGVRFPVSGVLTMNDGSFDYLKHTEFDTWKHDFQRRLNEEKANDPKTILGWALKAIYT